MSAWRAAWTAAMEGADTAAAELRDRLDALAERAPDVELELEMLDALERLQEARHQCASATLPQLETQHRVLRGEPCHFIAPAFLPTDTGQVSGRVLATPTRLVFVGGARTGAIPWHSVNRVARVERDVLLLRADGSLAAHYRFNTYADAAVAAHLASHFKAARSGRL